MKKGSSPSTKLPPLVLLLSLLFLASCNGGLFPDGDAARLTSLAVKSGILVPDFDPAILTYHAYVEPEATEVPDLDLVSAGGAVTVIKAASLAGSEADRTTTITVESKSLLGDSKTRTYSVIFSIRVKVASLALSASTVVLLPSGTSALTATPTPADASVTRVNWTSSDTSVAEVDKDGLVKAKSTGRATVTATSVTDPLATASCQIIVIPDDDVLASTTVTLEGSRNVIRTQQTNLGSLVANAMIKATGSECALINAGAIRTSLPIGDLSRADIYQMLPFQDDVELTTVSGADLDAILEHGVAGLPNVFAGYPQVAGVTFDLDTAQAAGNRVSNIAIRGTAVNPASSYSISCLGFTIDGGDGYSFPTATRVDFGNYADLFVAYLSSLGAPIDGSTAAALPEVKGRIAGTCYDPSMLDPSTSLPDFAGSYPVLVSVSPAIDGKTLFQTDSQGRFAIESVPVGDYTVAPVFFEAGVRTSVTVSGTSGLDTPIDLRFGHGKSAVIFLYANTRSGPLAQKDFRRALSAAIDRNAVATYVNSQITSSTVYAKDNALFCDTARADSVSIDNPISLAAYDSTAAAGFFSGATDYALDLLVRPEPVYQAFADGIREQLNAQAGLTVTKVSALDSAAFATSLQSYDFELARLGWGYGSPSGHNDLIGMYRESFFPGYDGAIGIDITGFDLTTFDSLLKAGEAARAAQDCAAYIDAVVNANNYLVNELPVIPVLAK